MSTISHIETMQKPVEDRYLAQKVPDFAPGEEVRTCAAARRLRRFCFFNLIVELPACIFMEWRFACLGIRRSPPEILL